LAHRLLSNYSENAKHERPPLSMASACLCCGRGYPRWTAAAAASVQSGRASRLWTPRPHSRTLSGLSVRRTTSAAALPARRASGSTTDSGPQAREAVPGTSECCLAGVKEQPSSAGLRQRQHICVGIFLDAHHPIVTALCPAAVLMDVSGRERSICML